ncbi:MAG: hypothetical protein M4579_002635 [Chaenotheca gracillima]|nr:MAG: hypothetical protein M4579_002635 [Chaenotheca gracillima]
MESSKMFLFGGDKPWNPLDWTATDDRVRGGSSVSYLDCLAADPIARFHGNLDIKTLGGAGFASQQTTGVNRTWDLSEYDGVELDIPKSDGKQYTLILKDEILPKNPNNGREQASISYEYDFKREIPEGSQQTVKVFIPWSDLKATYRGREKKDAPKLNVHNVRRVSLMMRSFFGTQEGPFNLSVRSISAVTKAAEKGELAGLPGVTEKQHMADGENKAFGSDHQDSAVDSVWRFCAIL